MEYKWLDNVLTMTENEAVNDSLSWAAFHAIQSPQPTPSKCLSALLPIFPDASHSTCMIKHSMNVVQRAVQFINPGQSPVLACDQPLFALAKEIQWTWPEQYGEDKFVVMFGGLPVEMAALKTAGQWLTGSGWNDALVHCGLATRGVADSFLHASHVKRTRYAHQVSAAALHILQRKSFLGCIHNDTEAFDDWCHTRAQVSPQFQYWSLTLELELTILVFVRSLRQSDF